MIFASKDGKLLDISLVFTLNGQNLSQILAFLDYCALIISWSTGFTKTLKSSGVCVEAMSVHSNLDQCGDYFQPFNEIIDSLEVIEVRM